MKESAYWIRIHRVIDYIEQHLDEEMSLDGLAGISCFSKYHFNRIFASMMGETLFQFISRLRMEKAAHLLAANPDYPITSIAYDVGFSSSSSFAKCFRLHFDMSATEFRSKSNLGKMQSNLRPMESNWREEIEDANVYTEFNKNSTVWRYEMETKNIVVEVKDLEAIPVAYIRYVGPYAGDSELFAGLFNRLFSWAGPRGLIQMPETKVLCIYHDDPGMTDENKLRTSVCISVPEDTEVSGEIGKMTIEAGKYAVGHFTVSPTEFGDAWQFLCGSWLPESGYEPADGLSFEMYLNDASEHPEGKFIVDICIPVKPLGS